MRYILGIGNNMETFVNNRWLTVEWSYLLHKNIGIKYIIGSPEEVENNIISA